jgi:TolA-binding protein
MSTKAELKENILASKLEGVVAWVVKNRSTALTFVGIAIAAFLISSVYILRQKEIHQLNLTRLAQAQSFLSQRQYEQANQILDDLAKTPTNGNFMNMVSFHRGLSALGMKDFQKAIGNFQSVVDSGGNSPLRPLALINLAFANEELKNYDVAAALYGRFMADYGDHFMAPRAQLSLGKNLALAGKIEDAKKALQQLIDLYPTSPWAENARSFLDKNKTR